MANTEYHVGQGLAGIYAGRVSKRDKTEWLDKSEVTNEAINAVMGYMVFKIKKGENSYALARKTTDGKYVRMKVEVCDHCPEWAKEVFGETTPMKEERE